MNSQPALYLGVKSTVQLQRLGLLDGSVWGKADRRSSFSWNSLCFFFPFYSLFSVSEGLSSRLWRQCLVSKSYCKAWNVLLVGATPLWHFAYWFELCCRLKGRKGKKDLTAVNWALMCLTQSVKNKSCHSDKFKTKKNLFSRLLSFVIYSTFTFAPKQSRYCIF